MDCMGLKMLKIVSPVFIALVLCALPILGSAEVLINTHIVQTPICSNILNEGTNACASEWRVCDKPCERMVTTYNNNILSYDSAGMDKTLLEVNKCKDGCVALDDACSARVNNQLKIAGCLAGSSPLSPE